MKIVRFVENERQSYGVVSGDGIVDADLVEFGWWLQEWRVSLFAQQLGTLESVSEKRLARRWQEMTGQTV
mgnify:CR=1 FL=1